jgi:hypothetical protein
MSTAGLTPCPSPFPQPPGRPPLGHVTLSANRAAPQTDYSRLRGPVKRSSAEAHVDGCGRQLVPVHAARERRNLAPTQASSGPSIGRSPAREWAMVTSSPGCASPRRAATQPAWTSASALPREPMARRAALTGRSLPRSGTPARTRRSAIRRRRGPARGVQVLDHAALLYSWMSPPRRSRRCMSGTLSTSSTGAALSGAKSCSPRCGRASGCSAPGRSAEPDPDAGGQGSTASLSSLREAFLPNARRTRSRSVP